MKKDYPNLWKRGLIQRQVRLRANHECEQCGMKFARGTNIAEFAVNKKGQPMIGTVHHIDHDKQNCTMQNLVYLCQSCHYLLHIYDWRPGMVLLKRWHNQPPRWIVARGIPYKPYPMRSIFKMQVRHG